MSEWSRGASRDIDGKTERLNGAFWKSDIEGKTARVAASELGKERVSNGREHMSQCGQRANFNTFNENLDLGTSALAERPINRDAFADLGNELSGDDF